MDRRRRSPPLMPPATSLPMRLSAHLSSPIAAMTSSARFSFCATGTLRSRRSSAVVTIVSRTVSVSRHTVVCATKPEERLNDVGSIGSPFTSSAPPVGGRRQARSFISDVLPVAGRHFQARDASEQVSGLCRIAVQRVHLGTGGATHLSRWAPSQPEVHPAAPARTPRAGYASAACAPQRARAARQECPSRRRPPPWPWAQIWARRRHRPASPTAGAGRAAPSDQENRACTYGLGTHAQATLPVRSWWSRHRCCLLRPCRRLSRR